MLGYSVGVEEIECTEEYEVFFLNLRPTTPTQLPPRMFFFFFWVGFCFCFCFCVRLPSPKLTSQSGPYMALSNYQPIYLIK